MKDKYLEIIENIALENIDSWDIVSKTQSLEAIYKLIHIYRWKCENKHLDWVDYINKTYYERN